MKPNIVAIVPVRLDSTRLPGKALREICGYPVLHYLIERLKNVKLLDEIVIATSDRVSDMPIVNWADANKVACYRGSPDDVLGRFLDAAHHYQADIVVRANGDNPLLAPEVIGAGLRQMMDDGLEFVTGKNKYTGLPIGIGIEVITTKTLERLDHRVSSAYYREHVTAFIFDNPHQFLWAPIRVEPSWVAPEISFTLDTVEDIETLKQVIKRLQKLMPAAWTIEEIISAYKEQQEE